MGPQLARAMEPLGSRYWAVLARAVGRLESDDRVVAVFVTGSVGRGFADAASDLDLLIITADDTLDSLLADSLAFVSGVVGPTVLARRLGVGQRAYTTITPTWERVDLSIVPVSAAARFNRADVVEVFDRDDIRSRMAAETRAPVRDVAAVSFTCEEFLRVLGLLDVMLTREEYLVAVEGVGLLRGHLRDLFVQEANLPVVGGVKRLNARLTPEQRTTLAALPAVEPTRSSVIQGHLAVATVFLPRARRLCQELDILWPEALHNATRRHLAERAGVDVPA